MTIAPAGPRRLDPATLAERRFPRLLAADADEAGGSEAVTLDDSDERDDDAPGDGAKTSGRSRGRGRRGRRVEPLLCEVAWEVCNQLGGIYTVLRSKAPAMVDRWGGRYFLVGPYNAQAAAVEFEPHTPAGSIGQVVKQLHAMNIGAHYGQWLVTGRPHVILLDYLDVFDRLHEVKYRFWADHGIPLPGDDELMNNVVAFSEVCRLFFTLLADREAGRRALIAHFHEWMGGAVIPILRRQNWPGSIVFTTHATLLGRYLAMNDDRFYEHLPFYHAETEADRYQVGAQYRLERAAAHGSHVFTTVSDVTGEECRCLLGRKPDVLVPNGLNIQRFAALHEFQNLHREYKQQIHRFTMGHFFSSYSFDLDKTIYLFTSGRFEHRNKGMDLTVEALARLNHRLMHAGSDKTVVAFFITRRPYRSVNVTALQSRAMLAEFASIADAVKEQVGDGLFTAAAAGEVPDLHSLADEYWILRLRRTIHAWKRDMPPGIVTHDLIDDQKDPLLNQLRAAQLWNQQHNPVKVVYHPEFIKPTNPLLDMEYDQFVRGCHLGVFPSYYEPWGYTPLESIALGVPAVTSDLSGFGSYLRQVLGHEQNPGLFVLPRRGRGFYESADMLADWLFHYCQLNRRERIDLRNAVESFSTRFDWHHLAAHYIEAHDLALDRLG